MSGSSPPARRARSAARTGWLVSVALAVLVGGIVLVLLVAARWTENPAVLQGLVDLLKALAAVLGILVASLLTVLGIHFVVSSAVRPDGPQPKTGDMPSTGGEPRWPFMRSTQDFLGLVIIVIFSVMLFLALTFSALSAQAKESSSTVMQISSAVLLAVIGFYFGSRGGEKAAERAEERADKETLERKKVEEAAGRAPDEAKANELMASATESRNRREYAKMIDTYEAALELNPTRATQANIRYEYIWGLLASPDPNYKRILQLAEEAIPLYRYLHVETGYTETYLEIVRAVALANLGKTKEALVALNSLPDDEGPLQILLDEGFLTPEVHLAPLGPIAAQVSNEKVRNLLAAKVSPPATDAGSEAEKAGGGRSP